MSYATRRLRNAARPRQGQTPLVKLRRLRVYEPRPGIVEIAAAIGFSDAAEAGRYRSPRPVRLARRTQQRTWAAAFRLERRHDRWQCTAAAVL